MSYTLATFYIIYCLFVQSTSYTILIVVIYLNKQLMNHRCFLLNASVYVAAEAELIKKRMQRFGIVASNPEGISRHAGGCMLTYKRLNIIDADELASSWVSFYLSDRTRGCVVASVALLTSTMIINPLFPIISFINLIMNMSCQVTAISLAGNFLYYITPSLSRNLTQYA